MILQYQHVFRTFGKGTTAQPALQGINLDVGHGEFVALMGASGSGKTTLLNLAAGFDKADRGSVHLCDHALGEMNETALAKFRRTRVGFIFQTLNLISTLTAAENIRIPLALCGLSLERQNGRVAELLSAAGLAERGAAFPGELSGGEQQRIAALRAVAHKPALVLLDEPTSNLDTANARNLLDLLIQLNQREGATLLMATHDERVAARANRIVSLLDGEVIGDE